MRKFAKIIYSVLVVSLMIASINLRQQAKKEREQINKQIFNVKAQIARQKKEIIKIEKIIAEIDYVENVGRNAEVIEIIVTNYYVGDSDNSGTTTASGKTIKDFIATNEGIYQYKGFDVLATANTTRWNRSLKEGYKAYELYDLITYELNGQLRTGIVLDVCGACHGLPNEDKQRIDVFTTHSVIGKKEGRIYDTP